VVNLSKISIHHRDTENTEGAQRKDIMMTLQVLRELLVKLSGAQLAMRVRVAR
jgi:hypothetical protein